MKNMTKKLLLGMGLLAAATMISCSKKDNSTAPDATIEVQFRFIGSADVSIENVVYYDGDSPVTNTASGKGSTWTSPKVRVKKTMASASANGIGSAASSTLKAQILQNGTVVKESGTSTGQYLNASITY